MKNKLWIPIMLTGTILMSGCAGDIPPMTEQQSEMVAEYSAALLLKYDSENHSRLVDTSSFMDTYNAALKLRNDAIAEYEAKIAAEEEARRQETMNQEASAEQYGQDTTPQVPSDSQGGEGDFTGGAAITSAMSIDEFLNLNGFDIVYGGYDVMNSYPEDAGSDIYFSLDATKGNDLLIVYFNVTNSSGESQKLDIFNKKAKFRLSVNGDSNVTALPTMLEDDLSMYLNEMDANASKRLVLVIEIEEGTAVSTLGLTVSTDDGGSITKVLSE